MPASLTDDEAAALAKKLARMDERSPFGPWTLATLRIIEAKPRVVSTELAAELGRERFGWKADVRKLKRLALTISHEVGYELSPRGRALLRWLENKR